ncbi:MAG: class II aldolase/adducin family protein [Chthonomonas sp.]|nr:class II aldolase/adducin family protein [Chthonomonas sp.]
MDEAIARSEICRIGHLLWGRGHIGAAEGNVSWRLDTTTLLCTPAGRNKGELTPAEIVLIDRQGRSLGEGRPSSEVQLHLECYDGRPDCLAVVHAHPPYATAFALAGEPIPENLLPEAAVFLGRIAMVPFAMPGTTAMRDAIRPYLTKHKTFLLQNHGAVTLGKTLEDAFARMDTLERVAAAIYRANKIGEPLSLPASAMTELREKYFNPDL